MKNIGVTIKNVVLYILQFKVALNNFLY